MRKFLSLLLTVLLCAMVLPGFSLAEEAKEDFSGVELTYWTAPFGDNDEAFFEEQLADWKAADLCADGCLDIFDLGLMKHKLTLK